MHIFFEILNTKSAIEGKKLAAWRRTEARDPKRRRKKSKVSEKSFDTDCGNIVHDEWNGAECEIPNTPFLYPFVTTLCKRLYTNWSITVERQTKDQLQCNVVIFLLYFKHYMQINIFCGIIGQQTQLSKCKLHKLRLNWCTQPSHMLRWLKK